MSRSSAQRRWLGLAFWFASAGCYACAHAAQAHGDTSPGPTVSTEPMAPSVGASPAVNLARGNETPPRAPGISLVPPPPLPRPTTAGNSAWNVVVLAAPQPRSRVGAVLLHFFEALAQESAEELSLVLEPNAVAHFSGGASSSALGSWLRRFTRADYRKLAPEAVFHPSRLDTFSRTDVDNLRESRAFPLVPDPTELLAQVTIDDPDVALLGSSMSFVLRPYQGGFRIRATFEELAP